MPAVAVITPTKNRRSLLMEAAASVRTQTYTDWEHWIIDDGSDDGTEEMVRQWASEDPRIRYLQRTGDRRGANVCRNLGIRSTTADLVVFLDSDDLLEPDCLDRRVSAMSRNADLDFATFQTSVFVEKPDDLGRQLNPDLIGDDLVRFLYFEFPWIITGPIWRRSRLLALGAFDEDLPSWQDVDLHIRAIAIGCKYLRFPEIDHHVRWDSDPAKVSSQQRRSPKHLDAALGVLEKFETTIRGKVGLDWVRQRALCSRYFFVAERWVEIGDFKRAASVWRKIRERDLGDFGLWASGIILLWVLHVLGENSVVSRLAGKWKGWMRLRTNPSLLKPTKTA